MQKVLSKSKGTRCSPQMGSQSMVDSVVKSVNVIHSDLKTHPRAHYYTPYCNQCDKKCFQKCHLTRHLKVHHGEKSYDCNDCGRKFIKKCYLSKHLDKHNTERSCQFRKMPCREGPYQCNECGKKIMTKSDVTCITSGTMKMNSISATSVVKSS